MKKMTRTLTTILAGVTLLAGCAADPKRQLERVAKDWAMTIRASQVIPVYPLTEDLQPGDVFVVSIPISKQTEIYEQKGFLSIDQLVTRLHGLPYETFYEDGYWKGTYASVAHDRPGWPADSKEPVKAPRAAFPTYNFSVDRSGGLKLAIPIQGVPVGLDVMGASRATGTVTMRNAYTYGIDSEFLVGELDVWLDSDPKVRRKLGAMASATESGVYLRVISRVYLAYSIAVTLKNLDTAAGGADVGAAQPISLPDLSSNDAAKVEASAKARAAALAALAEPLNKIQENVPGGSVRFVQASQRSVTMIETFDRPLVIGYAGLDVKVYANGQVSPPIPSFAVLSGRADSDAFSEPVAWTSDPTGLSKRYLEWLSQDNNHAKMTAWLRQKGSNVDPADLLNSQEHRALLEQAAAHFKF